MNKTKTNKVALPVVSIIVLNYNGKEYLNECFGSLEKLNYPKDKYEILMPDNASTDDSVEYVRKNFPLVKIFQLDKNYGYAGGNNRGSELANGKYIVFLNQDVIVNSNWLFELINSMQRNIDIKICGSKALQKGKSEILTFGGYQTVIIGSACKNLLDATQKVEKDLVLMGYAAGSSLLVEKNAFEYLGGFDETYFMYHEEADLCWRAWLYGYKVAVLLSAIVWRKVDN